MNTGRYEVYEGNGAGAVLVSRHDYPEEAFEACDEMPVATGNDFWVWDSLAECVVDPADFTN